MKQHKTWGGCFQKNLDPRVVKFHASLPFDHRLYPYDIKGSLAHARMLVHQGLIHAEEGDMICSGLLELQQELEEGLHTPDHSCEDVHMWIEQLLTAKIGEAGKKLHTGRSRNDQVTLDLRLYARAACEHSCDLLHKLLETLHDLETAHQHHLMPGYTHLQQAQPITLGQYFGAYYAMFSRDEERMQQLWQRLNSSPLGAGALAGSRLPLDRHAVAQDLGFSSVMYNTLDAVSDRDYVIEWCSVASLIMIHLSRLCEDMILWNTQEFSYITLDDAFATGSSLMPHKKNPDVFELIRGKSGRVFGHVTACLTMMKALPLAYNKDMQEDKEALFDTVDTLSSCLEIVVPCLAHTHFHTEHMHEQANSGFLGATALVEDLVLQGVPFRDAHHRVGQWVQMALQQSCSLDDIVRQQHNSEIAQCGKQKKTYVMSEQTLATHHKEKQPCHLLDGGELSPEDIMKLLHHAQKLRAHPSLARHALQDRSLVMCFDKPSFRTRLSFALAMQSMGGVCVESIANTRKKEEPEDMIRVLNGYADVVVIRTHEDEPLSVMQHYAHIPIINGLSAKHHPCQILADLLTLYDAKGQLQDFHMAYVGDANNILNSLLWMAPQMGVHVHYCCPTHHQPNLTFLEQAAARCDGQGGIHVHHHPQDAVRKVHAVYTDVWTSMGFEGQIKEYDFAGFQINENLMAYADPHAIFLHCMPMERGKEVSHTLPDLPCSRIFQQSENRLHIQKAILLHVLDIDVLD